MMSVLASLSVGMTAFAATWHVVEAGETLSGLAQHYGVSKTALIDTNGLQAAHIQIGHVLTIPKKATQHNIYTIKAGDSLTSVANKFDISLSELAAVNKLSPQSGLMIDSTLIIPNKLNDNNKQKKTQTLTTEQGIRVGTRRAADEHKTLASPLATKASFTPKKTSTHPNHAARHRIAYGDSLSSIAKAYGVDIKALAAANDLALDDTLYFGRYLMIPDSNNALNTKNSNKVATTARTPSYYVVKRGDTLMGVANKFNTHFMHIAKLTNIDYHDPLAIGQKLILPAEAATSTTTY